MISLKKIVVLTVLVFTTLYCVAQQCRKDSVVCKTNKQQATAVKKAASVKKDNTAETETEGFSIIRILVLKFM